MPVTPRFLWLLALGAGLFLLSGWWAPAFELGIAWNLLLTVVALLDRFRCPAPQGVLTVTRVTDDALSVAAQNTVEVTFHNAAAHPVRALLRDEPPPAFAREGERQVERTLPAHGKTTFSYTLQPPARGDYAFSDAFARVYGALGLTFRQAAISAAQPIRVFPNVQAIGQYELQLRRTQRARTGLKRARTMGAGREFASLRDYVPGDEFRTIDWKATARRAKVTARTFEAERTQDVILLIDEGRLMRQEIEYAQKLDHVVNAALMLSHVVSSGDDRVGLLSFTDTPRRWLTPRRGRAQTTEILHALYAVRAEVVESDYRTAFRYLATHWRKRSLVILFTDLADPDSSAMLLEEISLLAVSHLVVCVLVRDPLLSERAERTVQSAAEVFEKAVAEEALEERRLTLGRLEKRGVQIVDAVPEALSRELVARYLKVKREARL